MCEHAPMMHARSTNATITCPAQRDTPIRPRGAYAFRVPKAGYRNASMPAKKGDRPTASQDVVSSATCGRWLPPHSGAWRRLMMQRHIPPSKGVRMHPGRSRLSSIASARAPCRSASLLNPELPGSAAVRSERGCFLSKLTSWAALDSRVVIQVAPASPINITSKRSRVALSSFAVAYANVSDRTRRTLPSILVMRSGGRRHSPPPADPRWRHPCFRSCNPRTAMLLPVPPWWQCATMVGRRILLPPDPRCVLATAQTSFNVCELFAQAQCLGVKPTSRGAILG